MENDFWNSTIEVSPDVLSQEISGETVLLDLKSEAYFGLDPTATRIWQLLQERRGLSDVCQIMLDEFDVEPDVLKQDLRHHLGELQKAGLISVNGPEPS